MSTHFNHAKVLYSEISMLKKMARPGSAQRIKKLEEELKSIPLLDRLKAKADIAIFNGGKRRKSRRRSKKSRSRRSTSRRRKTSRRRSKKSRRRSKH